MRRSLPALASLLAACAVVNACTELRTGGNGPPDDVDEPAAEEPGQPPDGSRDASVAADVRVDAPSEAVPPASCDGPCPPEPIATNLLQATSIAVDDVNVYFAIESNNGTVYQCKKTGCGAAPITLGSGYATAIALDATRVYWGDFAGGKLVACTIGGCSQQPTTIAPNQAGIRGVSTDGVSLFWSTTAVGGAIRTCALGGACTPADVRTSAGTVIDVTADQAKVFWGSLTDKSVNACSSVPCSSPVTLGPGSTDVSAHAGKVYWVNGPAKTVVSCSAGGCAGNPLTIGTSLSPSHPVSDGKHVYWRDQLTDAIYRCPVGGCNPGPETIATKQKGQPGGQLALDGLYVYWTTSSGVYRVRK